MLSLRKSTGIELEVHDRYGDLFALHLRSSTELCSHQPSYLHEKNGKKAVEKSVGMSDSAQGGHASWDSAGYERKGNSTSEHPQSGNDPRRYTAQATRATDRQKTQIKEETLPTASDSANVFNDITNIGRNVFLKVHWPMRNGSTQYSFPEIQDCDSPRALLASVNASRPKIGTVDISIPISCVLIELHTLGLSGVYNISAESEIAYSDLVLQIKKIYEKTGTSVVKLEANFLRDI